MYLNDIRVTVCAIRATVGALSSSRLAVKRRDRGQGYNRRVKIQEVSMPRILVIDDEVSVRNTIRSILEHKGHHVVVAECGQRGAAAIQACAFDAVFIDIF